jgi:hypothetical protein
LDNRTPVKKQPLIGWIKTAGMIFIGLEKVVFNLIQIFTSDPNSNGMLLDIPPSSQTKTLK